jgi:hypothetical protein
MIIERLGGKCAICGAIDGLEIDHIDSKKKSFSIGRRLSGIAESKLEEEVKKCQLLCDEHHNDKSIGDVGKRKAKGNHGTISTYRYCHCEECKRAKRDYARMYKEKQGAQPQAGS